MQNINLSRKAKQGGERNADQSVFVFFFPFSLIGSLITAWCVVIMFARPLPEHMDALAATGCLKHQCVSCSSCFIWLPSHLKSMIYFGRAHVHSSLCHFLSMKTHWDYSFTAINNEWIQWGIMGNIRLVTIRETNHQTSWPNCIFSSDRQNVYPQKWSEMVTLQGLVIKSVICCWCLQWG